jgi:uncharacterized DUF497 family protein
VPVEWDPAKDRANRTKHGLGFDDVAPLFEHAANHLVIYDEDHSDDEDRFLAIGLVPKGLVVVSYAEPGENVIRILSARRATRAERMLFYERTGGRKS